MKRSDVVVATDIDSAFAVIVPNFVGAKVGCLPITDQNRHLLKSGYTRRKPDELAVLTRWFPESDVEVPEAKMLDVILYSRDQILAEYKAIQERSILIFLFVTLRLAWLCRSARGFPMTSSRTFRTSRGV
eukprot:scaffold337224_cov41-Prasinocladus_malaysianus.AAC.1